MVSFNNKSGTVCCSRINDPKNSLWNAGSFGAAGGNTFVEDYGQQGHSDWWSLSQLHWKLHENYPHSNLNNSSDNLRYHWLIVPLVIIHVCPKPYSQYCQNHVVINVIALTLSSVSSEWNGLITGEDHCGAALGEGTPPGPTSCSAGEGAPVDCDDGGDEDDVEEEQEQPIFNYYW